MTASAALSKELRNALSALAAKYRYRALEHTTPSEHRQIWRLVADELDKIIVSLP